MEETLLGATPKITFTGNRANIIYYIRPVYLPEFVEVTVHFARDGESTDGALYSRSIEPKEDSGICDKIRFKDIEWEDSNI